MDGGTILPCPATTKIMTGTDQIAAAKASLRTLLYARRAVAHAKMGQAGKTLAEQAGSALGGRHRGGTGGRTVSVFLPIRTEIDTGPLIAWLHDENADVVLPTICGDDPGLVFREWQPGAPTIRGAFGVREPSPGSAVRDPEILFVPLLGFDRDGYRIGYGGGYYDRAIARLSETGEIMTIGLAYDAQEVVHVPREAHDRRLDRIVTPARILRMVA